MNKVRSRFSVECSTQGINFGSFI